LVDDVKGGDTMATYIILLQYTQKGIENIKQSPARLDAAKKVFTAMGAELKEFYLVSGRYDMVAITEAPDYETACKIAITIGMQGNVRTETLSAFTEDEYRKIIAELP
jgi:uncharacterized protein with GYD domain